MHDVRPSGPMRVCITFLFEAYVTHYYRVINPLKIHERNSVIVMAEKLLITL